MEGGALYALGFKIQIASKSLSDFLIFRKSKRNRVKLIMSQKKVNKEVNFFVSQKRPSHN